MSGANSRPSATRSVSALAAATGRAENPPVEVDGVEVSELLSAVLKTFEKKNPSVVKIPQWHQAKAMAKHLQTDELEELFGKSVSKETVLKGVKECLAKGGRSKPKRKGEGGEAAHVVAGDSFCHELREVAERLPKGAAFKFKSFWTAAIIGIAAVAVAGVAAKRRTAREKQQTMNEYFDSLQPIEAASR